MDELGIENVVEFYEDERDARRKEEIKKQK
jgi:hypothetical protein